MRHEHLSIGRTKQKAQTRDHILQAAQRLIEVEVDLSLEDIAKEAGISRATIYRYYSNLDTLITEASLDIHHKSPEDLVKETQAKNLPDRLFYVQDYYNSLAIEHEVAFRRYLSALLSESISSKEPMRGARRVKTLKKILDSCEIALDEGTQKNLTNACALLMGIDALIVCKDVCKLSDNTSGDLLTWTLEMVLKGVEQTTGESI